MTDDAPARASDKLALIESRLRWIDEEEARGVWPKGGSSERWQHGERARLLEEAQLLRELNQEL